MKYKVGDCVLIREDLTLNRRYYMEDSHISDVVVQSMVKMAGQIATIRLADYKYKIHENGFFLDR